MNRILLRLSKITDLDLYAYFSMVEYRKSTLVKQLLRDYIRKESTVRIQPPHITYDNFTDPALPKILTISVQLNRGDEDIEQYLSDCPNGYRSKCMKSILRILLAPYTQSAFHREPVEVYVPARQYMENENTNPYLNAYPTGQLPQAMPYPYPYPYPMMYGMMPPAYMMNPQDAPAPQHEPVKEPVKESVADMPQNERCISDVSQEQRYIGDVSQNQPMNGTLHTSQEEQEIPISAPIREVPYSNTDIPEWEIPSSTEEEKSLPVEETASSDSDSEVDDAMFAMLTEGY